MTKEDSSCSSAPASSLKALRKRAETHILHNAGHFDNPESLSPDQIKKTLHELQVHQIELEMQNDELRTAQEDIEISRARYFDLYDMAPVGYCTVSHKGLILEANLTAAALLGTPRAALIKRSFTQFVIKEDQDIYYLHRKDLLMTEEPQQCELRLIRPDNEVCWVQLASSVAKQLPQLNDKHTSAPDLFFRVVIDNITQRKRAEAEAEAMHIQLQQARKMESVGRLAGGVAHDFNNMLSIILGYTDMALDQVSSEDSIHDDLVEIRKAAQRSTDLTHQLLAFASKEIIVPKVLDLNNIVAGRVQMLARLIGEDIELSWKPGKDLWPVRVDPSQIDQILTNLFSNSRDAISNAGKITIETENTFFDEEYCSHHAGFTIGSFVMLTVRDNGCGMDPETLSFLFEPFFTTKNRAISVGLGLSIVYGMVKQNKGFINVASNLGRGTAVSIYFPRHLAVPATLPEHSSIQAPVSGSETILLVEDETAVLVLTMRMLSAIGYRVLAANSPAEAISLAREHADQIDLLITDVIMPEMNGSDLARHLAAVSPTIQCLFMSGYTADVIAPQGILDEGVHFIQKPFSQTDLSLKLQQILKKV
jgi:PAS domain S-box-containing protein